MTETTFELGSCGTPPELVRFRSSGEPRNVPSPDINTEDFSAAVDFLGLQPSVDRERIGICGFGGMGLSAAAVDKRITAVVTTSMYDMLRVMANGYYDSLTKEQRTQMLEEMSRQRWADAERGSPAPGSRILPETLDGTTDPVTPDVLRLLPHLSWLPPTLSELERRLDCHRPDVVHECSVAHVHP